jgi:hypothetical protein
MMSARTASRIASSLTAGGNRLIGRGLRGAVRLRVERQHGLDAGADAGDGADGQAEYARKTGEVGQDGLRLRVGGDRVGPAERFLVGSHGAGRRLSRGQAKRNLDAEGLRTAMKGKTWNASVACALVDEDPRAYKDIRKVMADQSDLTGVVHVLHQVLNYKGTSG